jgi:hypothetical protein
MRTQRKAYFFKIEPTQTSMSSASSVVKKSHCSFVPFVVSEAHSQYPKHMPLPVPASER